MKHFLISVLVVWALALAQLALAAEKYFVVTAYNDFGESAYSEQVSCDPGQGASVTIQFNTVAEATGYKAYWSTTTGAPYEHVEDLGLSTTHTYLVLGCPDLTIICE